ncbi:unnamed protein product [Adineta steineri]|uniref:ATP-grasp domain-containing protein n=1 Tax=Adineta steineri TaxID=433720 RepID=A0A819S1V6_9BILA|nr:unnamed protein product [Adineta steineri]CAF4046125.1 unnamed protein product [Adineta steineri]
MMSNLVSVHILLGCLTNNDEDREIELNSNAMLCNEYGRLDNCNDIKTALLEYRYKDVFIELVTLKNYNNILDSIEKIYFNKSKDLFVLFNLCDGTETDGYPGISILLEIERRQLHFTGSDSYFFQITTSKPNLKRILQSKSVPTSNFIEVDKNNPEKSLDQAEKLLSYPMIIKPSIAYASLHISNKSVVNNREEALIQIETMFKIINEGIFIEKYLSGHEYTVLITGDEENEIKIFPVLERIFNSKLKLNERLLTFETYWSGYGYNGYAIQGEKLRQSIPVKSDEQIESIVRNAYIALNGNGYARVDIRTEGTNIYVLEVNANCSIGFGNNTPLGEILDISSYTPPQFVHHLIQLALNRNFKEKK